MLGTDMCAELPMRGHEFVHPSPEELDLTNPESVAKVAAGDFGTFDWCINCAAYTFVDKAETEQQLAHEVNALGPSYLAKACAISGVKLLHVSTDFVFDGEGTRPYLENDPTNPLGAYGRTKWEGEQAVLAGHPNSIIARTAWLYGPNGNSFPKTMIRAWEAGKTLRVVGDQVGCPTYTADLARVLCELVEKNAFPGIYHTTGPDSMSWHEFAMLTLEEWANVNGKPTPAPIESIRTEDWPTPTKRPKYSVLSFAKTAALGIAPMRPAREAVTDFCERYRALEGVSA
jgi:dTDP-4-dehydrorhamnose reductase